jgi:hypothetical protein
VNEAASIEKDRNREFLAASILDRVLRNVHIEEEAVFAGVLEVGQRKAAKAIEIC